MNRYQSPDAPSSASSTPEKEKNKKKGILGGAIADIKGAFEGVKKQAEDMTGAAKKQDSTKRRTDAELRYAKSYEDRRRREIAQEEFERAQAKRVREEEKRERLAESRAKRRH